MLGRELDQLVHEILIRSGGWSFVFESQHQHNVGDVGTQAQKQLCTREVHPRPTEQRWQEQTLGLPEYNE